MNASTTPRPTSPSTAESGRGEYVFDVIEHAQVALWMSEQARTDPEGFVRLVEPNAKDLARLYGPGQRAPKGAGWTHAWSVYANGLHWIIRTGPDGTVFLVRTPTPIDAYLKDPRVGVGIVRFLTELQAALTQ